VAGAVAEEILAAMTGGRSEKAYVNNGGDIALHLSPAKALRRPVDRRPAGLFGKAMIGAGDLVRGIATSGWRGRSFSLGIADAVTILAATAAAADAARPSSATPSTCRAMRVTVSPRTTSARQRLGPARHPRRRHADGGRARRRPRRRRRCAEH